MLCTPLAPCGLAHATEPLPTVMHPDAPEDERADIPSLCRHPESWWSRGKFPLRTHALALAAGAPRAGWTCSTASCDERAGRSATVQRPTPPHPGAGTRTCHLSHTTPSTASMPTLASPTGASATWQFMLREVLSAWTSAWSDSSAAVQSNPCSQCVITNKLGGACEQS